MKQEFSITEAIKELIKKICDKIANIRKETMRLV